MLYVAECRTLPDIIESSSRFCQCVSYAANGPKGGDNRQVYAKYVCKGNFESCKIIIFNGRNYRSLYLLYINDL